MTKLKQKKNKITWDKKWTTTYTNWFSLDTCMRSMLKLILARLLMITLLTFRLGIRRVNKWGRGAKGLTNILSSKEILKTQQSSVDAHPCTSRLLSLPYGWFNDKKRVKYFMKDQMHFSPSSSSSYLSLRLGSCVGSFCCISLVAFHARNSIATL